MIFVGFTNSVLMQSITPIIRCNNFHDAFGIHSEILGLRQQTYVFTLFAGLAVSFHWPGVHKRAVDVLAPERD